MKKEDKEQMIREMRVKRSVLIRLKPNKFFSGLLISLDKWIAQLQTEPQFDDGDDGV
jgi:hypothetical protein